MPKKKAVKRKAARKRKAVRKEPEHTLERGTQHFSDEVQRLGERFGANMERKGDTWDSWFHSTFGFIGPIISSVFGLLILGLAAVAIRFVNVALSSMFLFNVQAFLLVNLGLFFLVFLFFSYSSYFSKTSPRAYLPFSPLVTAAGISIGLWVAMNVVRIANVSLGIPALNLIEFWMGAAVIVVFWIALVIGYLILLVRIASGDPSCGSPTVRPPVIAARARKWRSQAGRAKAGAIHRLYRSGNDKILGGVCGGIAEYLVIDPTIIRLLWVILTLMGWGTGIIFYIILWIIVPRNPTHKWD